MYGNLAGGGAAASGAMLPLTGPSLLWYAVAGFTLVSAGLALLRLMPRRRMTER